MRFIGYQMISMMQNVSINRSDRLLTKADLNHIRLTAFLSYFPGTTGLSMTDDGKTYAKGMFGFFNMWYLKGIGNNKAQVKWVRSVNWSRLNYDSTISVYANKEWSDLPQLHSAKESNAEIDVSEIRQGLRIEKEEVKMILEISLFVGGPGGADFYYPDGTNVYDVFRRKRFGLFLADPPNPADATRTIFNQVLIFSPRPGIFNDEGPK